MVGYIKGVVVGALVGLAAGYAVAQWLHPRQSKPLEPESEPTVEKKTRIRFSDRIQVADALPNYDKSNWKKLSPEEKKQARAEVRNYRKTEMLVYPAVCPPQCLGNPLSKKRRHVWFSDQVNVSEAPDYDRGIFNTNERTEEEAEAIRVAIRKV